MSKFLSLILLAFIFVGYQNCGKKMDFNSGSGKAGLIENGVIDIIDVPDIPDVDSPDVAVDPGVIDEDDNSGNNGGDGNNGGGNNNSDNNCGGNNNGGNEDDSNDDVDQNIENETMYICIIEGSGKSQRLGFRDSELIVNGSTPQTVCTTQRACLEIASQKFNVVSAEYRGFCKNDSAKSISLSESELETLINK